MPTAKPKCFAICPTTVFGNFQKQALAAVSKRGAGSFNWHAASPSFSPTTPARNFK
jgi:hypothetical protein